MSFKIEQQKSTCTSKILKSKISNFEKQKNNLLIKMYFDYFNNVKLQCNNGWNSIEYQN
jgi:hypothetical protein